MNRGAAFAHYLPVIDVESAPFWAATKQQKFLIRHCNACGRSHFYPRHSCPHCWSDHCEWRPSSGRGRVYSYTVIHHNDVLPFKERLPYIVALIDLDEGVRVTTNIVEGTPEVMHVGMPVEVVYEHITDEVTLPQFRPRQQA
jgi:uncharacterized OB-fold protein